MIATRHRLVVVGFTLTMLLYIDRIAISAAKIPITSQLHMTDTQFGWMLSMFALGYAVFQMPVGALADRFGPRRVLFVIVNLWSLFTGLTALAWSFTALMSFRFLFGMAEAGAVPSCARTFYKWLPTGERALAQGVTLSGTRVGAAFALPVIAWLLTVAGWRLAFFILAGIGILWAVSWYLWFRDTPEEHKGVSESECALIAAGRDNPPTEVAEMLAPSVLLGSPNLWLAMGQYFASNFTTFFCLTWLFPYMQQTYNLSTLQTGLFSAIPLLGGALGNWFSGAVVDALYRRGYPRQSRQYPAITGFLLAAIGLVASLFFHTPASSVACLTLAIFGADMTLPPSWAFCVDIGRANSGMVSGTMNMAGNLGSFVTSLAFPYLLAATGSTSPFFVIGALLNILAAWLWIYMRPDRPLVSPRDDTGRLIVVKAT